MKNVCHEIRIETRKPDTSTFSSFLHRYTNPNAVAAASNGGAAQPGEDLTPDYMNVLGMIFSMCALMMRMKWCAWVALYCSCISFANTKLNDDTKQIMSSFM